MKSPVTWDIDPLPKPRPLQPPATPAPQKSRSLAISMVCSGAVGVLIGAAIAAGSLLHLEARNEIAELRADAQRERIMEASAPPATCALPADIDLIVYDDAAYITAAGETRRLALEEVR